MSAENIVGLKEDTTFTNVRHHENLASKDRSNVAELVAGACVDKGIEPEALRLLAEGDVVGMLLDSNVMGNSAFEYRGYGARDVAASLLSGVAVRASSLMPHKAPRYTGTLEEHKTVLGGEYSFDGDRRFRDFRKNGASRRFESGWVRIGPETGCEELTSIPIAVIGGGAAGTLTARALLDMGFTHVDLIDKRGKVGGIWQQENVRGGSKNNPFDLSYNSIVTGAATSSRLIRGSGQGITDYIDSVAGTQTFGQTQMHVTQGIVREIVPGDLSHLVRLEVDGKEEIREYPVVIYAPGIGKPLDVNGEGRLKGEATHKEAGIRWQQQLSDEKLKKMEGQRLVFVGLGNSTAEMVWQLQDYESRTGRKIDYRIITHYPDEMLEEPRAEFGDYGSLFRNTRKPELTKLAGDLSHIRTMYDQARGQGKIIGSAVKWHVEAGRMVVEDRDGIQTSIPYDQLYTLIGYGQDEKTLSDVGITAVDQYTGAAALDYDGEVQRELGAIGRERVYPGYFAIGPIAKTRANPNAIVIPGIQYQLNDMLAAVLLRCAEFAVRNPAQAAEYHKVQTALKADQARKLLQPDEIATDAIKSFLQLRDFESEHPGESEFIYRELPTLQNVNFDYRQGPRY